MDLLAVVRASQAISSEVTLDALVRTLLTVLMEQSGAQRGALVLSRGDELVLEVRAQLESGRVVTSSSRSALAQTSPLVPVPVLRQVVRTGRSAVLDDSALCSEPLSTDAYVAEAKPRAALCLPIRRPGSSIGLVYLDSCDPGAMPSADQVAALELLASQAALSLESAQLLSAVGKAREVAEHAEKRAALLAEAGLRLAEPLDYGERLQALVRLCVRFSLADWCVVDVLEDGEVRRTAAAHSNPAKESLLEELRGRGRLPPENPWATVMRTREPLLLRNVTDEFIRRATIDEEHARVIRELGTKSAFMLPLLARGHLLGILVVVSATPDRYSSCDVALISELARRASVAIDNARLYQASQEAVRLREEFLAISSHELFTPVTALKLSLQALGRGGASNPEKLIAAAARQGDRLHALISDLLEATRLEREAPSLRRSLVELGEVVRDVLKHLEGPVAASGCNVSVRGEATGQWDRVRLEEVVTKLLSNALKFGAGRPIEIRIGMTSDRAQLAVADQGIGIEPTDLAHIFDLFERAVSSQHYGGLGLGLYISRRIVEAHGGSIRVESQPGAGATFTVELPTGQHRLED